MNTQKQLIDEVIIHKAAGGLGVLNLTVTKALMQHLRDKEIEHLQDKITIKEIEAANENQTEYRRRLD